MKFLVAIIGKAGSGKDTIQNLLCERNKDFKARACPEEIYNLKKCPIGGRDSRCHVQPRRWQEEAPEAAQETGQGGG